MSLLLSFFLDSFERAAIIDIIIFSQLFVAIKQTIPHHQRWFLQKSKTQTLNWVAAGSSNENVSLFLAALQCCLLAQRAFIFKIAHRKRYLMICSVFPWFFCLPARKPARKHHCDETLPSRRVSIRRLKSGLLISWVRLSAHLSVSLSLGGGTRLQREDALLLSRIRTFPLPSSGRMLRSEPGVSPLLCPLKLDHLRGLNTCFCRSLLLFLSASLRNCPIVWQWK